MGSYKIRLQQEMNNFTRQSLLHVAMRVVFKFRLNFIYICTAYFLYHMYIIQVDIKTKFYLVVIICVILEREERKRDSLKLSN